MTIDEIAFILAVQTTSPLTTSLAFFTLSQHVGPTGRWCSEVSLRVASAVDREMKGAVRSGRAIDRRVTSSLATAPSRVAATIVSPFVNESTETTVPFASVTFASEGKHGSSPPKSPPPPPPQLETAVAPHWRSLLGCGKALIEQEQEFSSPPQKVKEVVEQHVEPQHVVPAAQ